MKTKYIILSLLLSVSGVQLSAQTHYSLSECKRIALENNRSIKNSQLDIKASEESKKEAFTNFFPTVSASGLGFKANDPLVSMEMGGTKIGLLDDGMAGAITLSQPVFVGGKIINGNKLSKLGIEVSQQQARLSENDVMSGVENSYWQMIGLYEKINTLDILDKQLASLLSDVEMSYKAGLITNNDVLQVKLKQNEVRSNRANLENGIALLKMVLCKQLGLNIEDSEQFDIIKSDINNIESPVAYYVNHREALNNRAENILLEKNVDASKLQTKMKRADYMPTVAVGATYMQNNLMNNWEANGAVFVSVSVPISGWWGGSHAIRKERINEQIAYNNKLDGQDQLLLQMQSVKNDLDNAYKQTLIAKEAIEESDENLRLNTNYFKAGMISLSDLFDAQRLMQESRDRYANAYSEYQKKRFEYLQVTGR